uniref:Uncharacterized protein n=1 Tax=viral metagenome TaxID=1070528 RepID=A0A6M3J283_9ZZZZ
MSLEERTGTRDLLYSGWHRPSSISRYVSKLDASLLGMIDLDAIEVCTFCKEPLALIETKSSFARERVMTYTAALGRRARVPVFLVVYTPTPTGDDIASFLIQRHGSTETWTATPAEYATWLLKLRSDHSSQCSRMNPRLKARLAAHTTPLDGSSLASCPEMDNCPIYEDRGGTCSGCQHLRKAHP